MSGVCYKEAEGSIWVGRQPSNPRPPLASALLLLLPYVYCLQVQEAFDHLLEAVTFPTTAARQLGLTPPPGCTAQDGTAFLQATARAVLDMSPRVKGRYSPLTALLPRVGARWLLQQEPGLVNQALTAMQDDMVANTATTFFKALLSTLRQEVGSSSSTGGDAAAAVEGAAAVNSVKHGSNTLTAWCQWWMDPLLAVLWGSDDRQRMYVATHALPAVLQLEPALLQPLVNRVLAAAGAGSTPGQPPVNATAALVVVLKAARQLMLIGDLDALTKLTAAESAQSGAESGGSQQQQQQGGLLAGGASPLGLLMGAITGDAEALRCDTLELACVNPR